MESLGCLMSRVHCRTGTDKLVEKFLLLFLSSAFQVDISAALQTEDSCHMIRAECSQSDSLPQPGGGGQVCPGLAATQSTEDSWP